MIKKKAENLNLSYIKFGADVDSMILASQWEKIVESMILASQWEKILS